MPLCGMNNQPVVQLPKFGRIKIEKHEQISFLESESKHPVRFFLEPVIGVVNYATSLGFRRIDIIGFSGGGGSSSGIARSALVISVASAGLDR